MSDADLVGVARSPRHLELLRELGVASFQPFWRAYDGTRDGSGLGLKVVPRLSSTLGDEVEVESELGVGRTFILTLPRQMLESGDVEPAP